MTAKDDDGDFGVHGSDGGDDLSPFRIGLDIDRHVTDWRKENPTHKISPHTTWVSEGGGNTRRKEGDCCAPKRKKSGRAAMASRNQSWRTMAVGG